MDECGTSSSLDNSERTPQGMCVVFAWNFRFSSPSHRTEKCHREKPAHVCIVAATQPFHMQALFAICLMPYCIRSAPNAISYNYESRLHALPNTETARTKQQRQTPILFRLTYASQSWAYKHIITHELQATEIKRNKYFPRKTITFRMCRARRLF